MDNEAEQEEASCSVCGNLSCAIYFTREEVDTSAKAGCQICFSLDEGLTTFLSPNFSTINKLFLVYPNGTHTTVFSLAPTARQRKEFGLSGAVEQRPGLDFLSVSIATKIFEFFWLEKSGAPWKSRSPVKEITHPGTDDSFCTIQTWMNRCSTEHALCVQASPKELPRRVLCAMTFSEDIKLVEDLGTPAEYIALSHVWGSTQPVKTTKESLPQMKERIPWASLPKTFQHAVTITRSLKKRYIWIDSLCIIQDDEADWFAEARKMRDVYANAWLTIAATSSTGCNSGMFVSEPPPCLKRSIQLPGSREKTHVFIRKPVNLHTRTIDEQAMTLGSRAWTFQEAVLSPRFLHFTRHEMLWECRSSRWCECSHYNDTPPYEPWVRGDGLYATPSMPEPPAGFFEDLSSSPPQATITDLNAGGNFLFNDESKDRKSLEDESRDDESQDNEDNDDESADESDWSDVDEDVFADSLESYGPGWVENALIKREFDLNVKKLGQPKYRTPAERQFSRAPLDGPQHYSIQSRLKPYQFFDYWHRLLEHYFRRRLSFTKDRLPALAGITQHILDMRSLGTNFAGLWLSELPLALLWYVEQPEDLEQPTVKRSYPTWSWASCQLPYGQYSTGSDSDDPNEVAILVKTDPPLGQEPQLILNDEAISVTVRGRLATLPESILPANGEVAKYKSLQCEFHLDLGSGKRNGDSIYLLEIGTSTHALVGPVHKGLALTPSSRVKGCYERIGTFRLSGKRPQIDIIFGPTPSTVVIR